MDIAPERERERERETFRETKGEEERENGRGLFPVAKQSVTNLYYCLSYMTLHGLLSYLPAESYKQRGNLLIKMHNDLFFPTS